MQTATLGKSCKVRATTWSVGLALLLVSCFLGLGGCAAAGDDGASGGGDDVGGDELHYADVSPIIAEKCLRCHTDPPENGAPIALDSYAKIVAERSEVERVLTRRLMPLLDPDLMPPVEDLTTQERNLLIQWLQAGAPE